MWFSPGPLDDEWKIPAGKGHKFLMQYMLAQQTLAYGSTILEQFDYKVLVRNMKLLCKKYPENDLKRAIALACLVSEHPFSTKFIEEQVVWLKALREAPIPQFYQNKS